MSNYPCRSSKTLEKGGDNVESNLDAAPGVDWAVPENLKIPTDPLRCRLDFHHQAVVLTLFDGDLVDTKIVSALDVSHSLASELSFGTGLLPANTLWWKNTRRGPVFALYEKPKVRHCALLEDATKTPRRFELPMPGFIFLCTPVQPPWVYAVKKRPTKETDDIFKAPLCNIFDDGRSCPGTHNYPDRVADIPKSFFTAFYTPTANLANRSNMFPQNIVGLWEHLDKKKQFPTGDLVRMGTIRDLMMMEI
jgi:hypothetical protein